MPFKATYSADYITKAAQAEDVTPAVVGQLVTGLKEADLNGLLAFVADPANDGSDLTAWRTGFPAVFGKMSDEEASAVIRAIVPLAGGMVV